MSPSSANRYTRSAVTSLVTDAIGMGSAVDIGTVVPSWIPAAPVQTTSLAAATPTTTPSIPLSASQVANTSSRAGPRSGAAATGRAGGRASGADWYRNVGAGGWRDG